MKPIFFVTRNFPPAKGGIESMAHEILGSGLASNPGEIILIHLGQKRADKLSPGLRGYYHLPGKGMASTILISTLAVFILALVFRPRAIVNMQVTTALGSFFACRLLGIPLKTVALGLEVMKWPNPSFEWMKRKILQGCTAVVSISHYTRSLVLSYGVDPEKASLIHPGVRPDDFPPAEQKNRTLLHDSFSDNNFICLFAGRLVKRKGADKCIEAINILKSGYPQVRLVIAGTGPDESRLKELTRKLDVKKQVVFAGAVAEGTLPGYYANADLFIMPSRMRESPPQVEGFGIVYLEAASAGLPCIGSTEGGAPDAVVHDETGFNTDPNDEQALADLIKRFISEPELARKMGQKGRKRVLESFDWKVLAAEFNRELFKGP